LTISEIVFLSTVCTKFLQNCKKYR